MENPNLKIKPGVLITIILTAMNIPAFTQNLPACDKIVTTAGNVEMYFIGHGSLMFKTKDLVIYFDPVSMFGNFGDMPKGDLIFVTHEHEDHLDTKLIAGLRKPDASVYGNKAAASLIPGAKAVGAGEKFEIAKIGVEVVQAYNIVHERKPGVPFHAKGSGVGYILTIGDKRFYIAGDTENIPEMKALKGINVAFLPMNLPYTMTPEMVADAALAFKPEILYPYHFGDTDTGKIIELLKNTNIEVRIRNLK